MKVAIVGGHLWGFEFARLLAQQEVNITWFDFNFQNRLNYIPNWQKREFCRIWDCPIEKFTDVINFHYDELSKQVKVNQSEVLRVHKANLQFAELHEEQKRLKDFFRVVYKVDASQIIERQKARSPEAFKSVDDKTLTSLKSQMEAFEDFDLVIDGTVLNNEYTPIGSAHSVIGEMALPLECSPKYGIQAFAHNNENLKEIAIIGNHTNAAELLTTYLRKFDQGLERIFVISTKSSIEFDMDSELSQEFTALIENENKYFDHQVDKFKSELAKWNELESYMQAKITRPQEPIPRFVFFGGHNITAIDRLIDQDRFFLTCERPEFREVCYQKENAQLPLKTIGVDAVFVQNQGQINRHLYQGLNLAFNFASDLIIHPEDGLYSLQQSNVSSQFNQFMDDVMRFFSRSEN